MTLRKLKKRQQEKHGYFNTTSVRNSPLYTYDPFTGATMQRKGMFTGRFRIGTGQRPWRKQT